MSLSPVLDVQITDGRRARTVASRARILEAMIDQMNKATASAEAAIDDALVEVDRSND